MASERPANFERLYFKTYLAMVKNAPGTEMFRNFYLRSADGSEVDAIDDGANACAFFVSSVLTLFRKAKAVHGTITSTVRDLEESGWQTVDSPEPGDVIVWEESPENNNHGHIGFYLGGGRAVSTSTAQRKVAEHDLHYGAADRGIVAVYRLTDWSA